MKTFLIMLMVAFAILAGCDRKAPEEAVTPTFLRMDSAGFDALKAENQGKVLVVNVFASWCPPCKVETPDFVSLWEETKGGTFALAGLSIDKSAKDLAAFVQRYRIGYPVYMIDGKLQRRLFADKVPVTIVYRPDGRLFTTALGAMDKETLREIVAMAAEG